MKLFKPEVFQGSLQRKNYFEGWYFKHVSADEDRVYSFIPGISLKKNDAHAFIQVINGITGASQYISYPVDAFSWKSRELYVKVGNSEFTSHYIDININEPAIQVRGRIAYQGLSPYPASLISPGIMGWYSYVPFMECYHGVVSANHHIEGKLEINLEPIDFTHGKGYIEKDWGTSFPECWIWTQSNSFPHSGASVFVSIAKIPWLGKFFMGFIAFLYLDGQYYRFASYNHSKLTRVKRSGNMLEITLKNKSYTLSLEVETKNSGNLIAPVQGNMTRRIKESIDSNIFVKLISRTGEILFEQKSQRAGLEIIESIFDYFP